MNKFRLIANLFLASILITNVAVTAHPARASGACGTGTWTSGNLEIHHINIGQGDSALIVGPTGRSLLLDAGETNWNSSSKANIIGPHIESVLGCKSLDYVLISHFHLDHIGYVGYGGLWNLVESQGFTVGTTLVRDYTTYLGDTSGTFTNWKTYLEGDGQSTLHPVTAVEGTSQVDLGPGVTFDVVALDGNGALIAGNFSGDANPPSENDYSIGVVLSYGAFDEWLGGDLDGEYSGGFGYTYHDIELSTAPEVGDVDVYKANHHGSSHSSSATFINQLDPEVSVISAGNGNSYGHPTQATIDRLLATSTVYLTERGNLSTNIGAAIVAGNIVIKTSDGTSYTVNGTSYTATEPIRTDIDGDGYFAEADPDDNNINLEPTPNGGCGAVYQTCAVSCQISAGQVLINEVLPAPSSGPEWVELYNTTNNTLNLGYCYIDDIAAGSAAYQIPASTLIPARGFWTLDRTTYFNNTGDDVRFLKEDASTVLDSYTYGNTSSNAAWYRLPDGGAWAMASTLQTTKGLTNTLSFYPIVSSISRINPNPANTTNVNFNVNFSKIVTGVNNADFTLTTTGITGASITNVSGSGNTYTVTVNTGIGDGTIRLNVVDDDSIKDTGNNPLGGAGTGNGNFTYGETYTIIKIITLTGNAGVAGATLSYMDNGIQNVIADEGGNYSITVPSGWSGVVTPYKSGYTFTPVNKSYNTLQSSQTDQNYTATLCVGCANVNGSLGGNPLGSYTLASGQTVTPYYDGIVGGPVLVESTNGINILTSEHRNYQTSFSETLGYPDNQLTTAYWFTRYAYNANVKTWILVTNPSNSDADVEIYIGDLTTPMDSFSLTQGMAVSKFYNGLAAGPVLVKSTNGVDILASEHRNYQTSFSESLGYPHDQLTTAYWFTRYAYNANVKTWILVTNPSNIEANVEIYIGDLTTPIDSFTLTQGTSVSKFYNGLANGPVFVKSTNGVDILASEHRNYQTSFSESLGYPANQLTTAYWFTRYAYNANVKTWLLIANPDPSQTAEVEVYIGSDPDPIASYSIVAGATMTPFYNGVAGGPVRVVSTNGVDVLASEHRNYQTSFSETLGYPDNQLTTKYWFTRYAYNANVKTWLLIANP